MELAPASGCISQVSSMEPCPICFDAIHQGSFEELMLECGHAFHRRCMTNYMGKTLKMQPPCPVCRSPMTEATAYMIQRDYWLQHGQPLESHYPQCLLPGDARAWLFLRALQSWRFRCIARGSQCTQRLGQPTALPSQCYTISASVLFFPTIPREQVGQRLEMHDLCVRYRSRDHGLLHAFASG